jgi:hypothetical protein
MASYMSIRVPVSECVGLINTVIVECGCLYIAHDDGVLRSLFSIRVFENSVTFALLHENT